MLTKSVEVFDRSVIGRKATLLGFIFSSVGVHSGDYYVDATLYDEDRPAPLKTTFRTDEKMLRSLLEFVPDVFRKLIENTVIANGDFLVIDPSFFFVEIPGVAGKVFWSDVLERPCLDVEWNFLDPDFMKKYAARRTG